MDQLTQKLRSGAMRVIEAPLPLLAPGTVLVRTFYSLISAGTEASTVKAARKGFIGKAKERPDQFRQVLESLRSKGPLQTYRAVMKKLEAHSPLGYSLVGEILQVADDIHDVRVGDVVACGGKSACHAEVVCMPRNLCVPLDLRGLEGDALEQRLQAAAYNTLGAIAMQGIRQADLRLGENCLVIGLGLIGQLTCLLLRASGVGVVGVDISPAMVEHSKDYCVDLALARNAPGVRERILEFTHGLGCDAVIITAATNSLDPVNFAGAAARKRGVVVIVGDVPTGFDREPHYYKKELSLRMSCSYGPGRYDQEYEDKGRDYPPAYVRWTENRNMQAFQKLVLSGRIDLAPMTTHCTPLAEASSSYDMILKRNEPFLGILIAYDRDKPVRLGPVRTAVRNASRKAEVVAGFLGAGSYAQSHLLPHLKSMAGVRLEGVMTSSSAGARSVADRYGFAFCSGEVAEILNNEDINTVFIASRHDSHGEYVCKALEAGKNVFVEKPLCLKAEELARIAALLNAENAPLLMVGYNRRFSPLSSELRSRLGQGPVATVYRVNAGFIPAESWIQDREIGGGRILGEVCHFVDYLMFLAGAAPRSVHAVLMDAPQGTWDTLSVNLAFPNGSIGTVHYFANGPKDMPKERIEAFSQGLGLVLDDFKELHIHGAKPKAERKKLTVQDKGQKEELERFVTAIRKGEAAPIAADELLKGAEATLAIEESIKQQRQIDLPLPIW